MELLNTIDVLVDLARYLIDNFEPNLACRLVARNP